MKTKRRTKKHEPDDSEMRAEYHFDFRKAKPNRFVLPDVPEKQAAAEKRKGNNSNS
jgi:hypothetical protein